MWLNRAYVDIERSKLCRPGTFLYREKIFMKSVLTRLRAYQLGTPGSSFSYFADGHFTMLEGRLTELNRPSIIQEMRFCRVETADTLHITSWDADHCSVNEIEELLQIISPARIE